MLFLYFLVYVHICIVCYPCGVTINDDDDDEYSRPMKQTDRQTGRQTDTQCSVGIRLVVTISSLLCRCLGALAVIHDFVVAFVFVYIYACVAVFFFVLRPFLGE